MRPRVDRVYEGRAEPRLMRWGQMLLRLGGGTAPNAFDATFFHWWSEQIPVVEDYPYAGIDYREDYDLVLPPDARWGLEGKKTFDALRLILCFCVDELIAWKQAD